MPPSYPITPLQNGCEVKIKSKIGKPASSHGKLNTKNQSMKNVQLPYQPKEIQHSTNPSAKKFYHGDSLASKLENLLLENNIPSIGDYSSREKLRIKIGQHKGNLRSALLNLNKNERAYRTKDISFLSEEALLLLHDFEQKRMPRFVIGPSEIRKILKLEQPQMPDQIFMNPPELEQWISINEKAKPPMKKLSSVDKFDKFKEWLIPPYFAYDNTFDGMNWHHQIDWNAWKIIKNLT